MTYSESLGVRVVNVGVILVGHVRHWSCDYSLTLDRGVIVGDSRVVNVEIGLIGNQGIGCDL